MNNNIIFNLCDIGLSSCDDIDMNSYNSQGIGVIYRSSYFSRGGSWFSSNRWRILWF